MSAAQSPETDALPCVHCGDLVELLSNHHWTHLSGLSRCQSPDVEYGHLAHPAGVPCRADGPNPCLGARVIPSEVPCDHTVEWVGVDMTAIGNPNKVWRCTACDKSGTSDQLRVIPPEVTP